MIKKLILIALFFYAQKAFAVEISGFPKIVDGDTIHIKSYKIRLEGIDAPEINQKCKKNYFQISYIISFNFQKEYFCGRVAKRKLAEKLNKKKIKCILSKRDRYKRYLGECFLDKENINKWMVKQGYAIAYRRYSTKYILDENFAQKNKLGLWNGSFMKPEKWRKKN